MWLLFTSLLFVLGASFGSYLSVVLARWQRPNTARFSQCPHCHHRLMPLDLVPVVSYFLRGFRCHYCRKPISWQYPAIEVALGGLFVLAFVLHPAVDLELLFVLVGLPLTLLIFIYDLRHLLIPLNIVYVLLALTFFYQLSALAFSEFFAAVLASLVAGAIFWLIYFISKATWLGLGDVPLAAWLGLFLGFPAVLVAFFIAFMVGAIMGLALMLFAGKTMTTKLPFAPFLLLAAWISWWWGPALLTLYLGFLGL